MAAEKRRFDFEGNPVGMRAGCALVFFPALIGTAGLADYSGPGGWRGFAEFFGWWGLCFAVTFVIARLFNELAGRRALRTPVSVAISAIAIGFAVFTYFTGAPETPLALKRLFTGFLQIAGVAAIGFVAFFAYVGSKTRRPK